MRTDQPERQGWTPPHCPNPKCQHHKRLDGRWPWIRRGFYTRPSDRRRVQRFRCRTCLVTFSTQTFSLDYWQKRRDLPRRIFMRLVGCMAARQIARDLAVAPETVNHHISRLGRHCMLFHMQHWRRQSPFGPLVIDGFESYEYSQYHPIHHHVAVEAETDFFLYHTESELRRKGRMTAFQKKRRAELEERHGRPDPQAIRRDMTELLEVALTRASEAVVRSDEHRSYPPAIRRLPCRVRHEVTNSKRPRTAHNPLFPVNLLDLLIRHCSSNHKRETIAFSKRRQASAERLSVLMVWRNYIKSQREKRPGQTPAMLKGLLEAPLEVSKVLARRLFPGRTDLPPRWDQYYRRTVRTRELSRNRTHSLRYAY